jgi:hypothetical protein
MRLIRLGTELQHLGIRFTIASSQWDHCCT